MKGQLLSKKKEQNHHDKNKQREQTESGTFQFLPRLFGRKHAPDPPDVLHHERQKRDKHKHGKHPAETDPHEIVAKGYPDRASDQKRCRIPDQRQHSRGVADDGGQDYGAYKIDIQGLGHPDDDGGEQYHRGGIGKEGADGRHQDNEPQEEPLAAAARRSQKKKADLLEETRWRKGAGNDHPAEQEGKRTAGGLHRIHKLLVGENPENKHDAHAQKSRQRHVEPIERYGDNHSRKGEERDRNLQLTHEYPHKNKKSYR